MSQSAPTMAPARGAVPPALFNACFVLVVINVTFFAMAIFSHWWIYDAHGRGTPTDFVNVWAAGRLVLEGHPALAYDWDIQKKIELAILHQDFVGYFAWHYPPPFLFVATLLAQFPYATAFVGWIVVSFLPYLAVMRAIVGRNLGFMLAFAFPMVLSNTLVGQNGFFTASLIGGTLYLLPKRPLLSGICLGLLTYKPQYGVLFPIVLIAASQWRVFFSAAVTAVVLALASAVAFGIESWHQFFHWMPMFSQAFLVEGKATWWKLQSLYSLLRYLGGPEQLAWACQWVLTASIVVVLVTLWRSNVRYSLKAAALAAGTLLATPYLFMYDVMVLAIPVGFLVRVGLARGFRSYELPALGCTFALILSFVFVGEPVGCVANMIVFSLILRRAGPWWRREPIPAALAAAGA